jgi:hypothetical protein
MPEANLMNKATQKTGSANSRVDRFLGTAPPRFRTSLPGPIHEKIFENLPRVFFEEKPRGELRKAKPTKENRKDAHAAIKS